MAAVGTWKGFEVCLARQDVTAVSKGKLVVLSRGAMVPGWLLATLLVRRVYVFGPKWPSCLRTF